LSTDHFFIWSMAIFGNPFYLPLAKVGPGVLFLLAQTWQRV